MHFTSLMMTVTQATERARPLVQIDVVCQSCYALKMDTREGCIRIAAIKYENMR